MANLDSKSYHSLIGFLTPEYLGFLKLQVVPRFTGTCISPVPVNQNQGIFTSLFSLCTCGYMWRSILLLSNFCLILRDLLQIYFNFGMGNMTSTCVWDLSFVAYL
jgi:hypothetical protein